MINKDLERFIEGKCPFEVTNGQREMIAMTADFLLSGDKDGLCLWRGYAGTGKTSVLSALVRALDDLKQKTVLMAPTGRAAKVFALHAGIRLLPFISAYTVRRLFPMRRTISYRMSTCKNIPYLLWTRLP